MEKKMFKVKSAGEDGVSKVVGEVEVPIFESKNLDAGLKEIIDYDWKSVGYENGYKQAVVELINTQHGTNLRNALRQKNSGKVSGAWIEAQAMSRITVDEFQGAVGDANKFAALLDRKKVEVKAELEAKRKAAQEASGIEGVQEKADESDAADTEEVTGTAPAVVA